MKKTLSIFIVLIYIGFGMLLSGCATKPVSIVKTAFEISTDVTQHIEVLGNPYLEKYPDKRQTYARNIWDMCAFKNELLIGGGNSSNIGPARNAGPVPVIAYSPATRKFRTVLTVDDEQIDVFCIMDGDVYIPGHDPKESWKWGNFYRLEKDGAWHKYRNIPNGIHNYDMAMLDGVLFAGLGTRKGAAVAISRDRGTTWSEAFVPNGRIYSFLVFKDKVYATAFIPGKRALAFYKKRGLKATTGFYQYDGKNGFQTRNDLTKNRVFPGIVLNSNVNLKITRSVSFKGSVAYIGAYCHNDHQFMPFGAFIAKSLKKGKVSVHPVPLPSNSRVWDILYDKDTLYVLTDSPLSRGTTVRVLSSPDGERWTEVMHFSSKTFARSFALLNGDFYFGFGCELSDPRKQPNEELPPETGQILRVREKSWKQK
jgi:hypothetical protein